MANSKSKKRRKWIVFSIIVLALAGLTLAAVFKRRDPVITVQSEIAVRTNLTEIVVANGKIQPVLQVKISPEVSGEIIDLPVKEGQQVKKGDLLVKIRPDTYEANVHSSEAGYLSAVAGKTLAEANLRKAELDYKRNEELFSQKLIAETDILGFKTAFQVAAAQVESSVHQVAVAQAALDLNKRELAKTTIYSPLNGTVSKLNSRLGERVVGTSMMAGTEIMIVADLNEMEAIVDIGEIDIVLIALNQNTRLEVDAFRDRKFKGVVSEIANSSKGSGVAGSGGGGGQSQEATKFEVKVRVAEKENFRPGMSVTAEIETRSRTNVLAVPIQSVTTRLPKSIGTNSTASARTDKPAGTNVDSTVTSLTTTNKSDRKAGEGPKPIEVVFVVNGEKVKMMPVKRGISDDTRTEIIEGLKEGDEVISGGYKAISRELEDGKKIKKGGPEGMKDKEKEGK